MASLAKVTIIGNVGRDPETKQVAGNSVVEFSVAVSDGRKNAEHTTWYRCQSWGKRGEPVMRFVHKGSAVCVTGRLSTREYTGKSGPATSVDIDADDVVFLDKRADSAGAPAGAGDFGPPPPGFDERGDDDDVPF